MRVKINGLFFQKVDKSRHHRGPGQYNRKKENKKKTPSVTQYSLIILAERDFIFIDPRYCDIDYRRSNNLIA